MLRGPYMELISHKLNAQFCLEQAEIGCQIWNIGTAGAVPGAEKHARR